MADSNRTLRDVLYKLAEQILQQQKISRKKFGEVALDLKILTHDQVKDLVSYQKDFNIQIGDIFKYEGALQADELEREIEEFAQQNKVKEKNSK